MRKFAPKLFLLAVAVRWNQTSEGVALQIKFNDCGIISYVDWNNLYNCRHTICILTNNFVPFYFSCLYAGLDLVGVALMRVASKQSVAGSLS